MDPWALAFVGVGIVLAIIGACVVLINWGKADQGSRQLGWIILVAGLAMAAMTIFGARMPFRPH